MSHNLELVEAVRAQFRPDKIMTLFVGESAPASGKFFYFGNNPMLAHTKKAIEQALGVDGADILDRFKAFGWYLDDLSLVPIDHLPEKQRVAIRRAARQGLAERIAEYRPQAIVSVLKRIEDDVEVAAITAGCDVPRFVTPFPGRYHQNEYVRCLVEEIIPRLPRL
jgi:hypothetical protein